MVETAKTGARITTIRCETINHKPSLLHNLNTAASIRLAGKLYM